MNIYRNITLKEQISGRFVDEEVRCSRICPVIAYDDDTGFFISADNTLGICIDAWALSGGEQKDHERLSSLLNSNFPAGTMISIFWFRSPDILRPLAAMAKRRDQHLIKHPEMAPYIKNRVKFFNEGSKRPINAQMGTTVFDIRLVISAKIPLAQGKPDQSEMQSMENIKHKLMGGLDTIGFAPRLMNAYEFVRFLNPVLNWSDEPSWRTGECEYDPTRPISDQVFDYDTDIHVEKGHLKIGKKYVRTISAKRFPKNFYFGNALAFAGDLKGSNNNLKVNYAITCNIYYLDPEKDKNSIENKRVLAVNQAKGRLIDMVPILADKKRGFDLIYDSMNEGFRPVRMSYSLTLFSDSLEQLQTETTAAITLWREHRFDMMEDTFIQLPLFMNNLPLGADVRVINDFFRYKTLTTEQATVLLPIFGEWKGTGTPHVNLVSRNGQLMSFSITDSGTNKNLLVCATSGGGKSFFINELIISHLTEGAKIWVVDVGRSYQKLAEQLGKDAQFIHFGSESRVCINPFEIVVSLDGTPETRSRMLTQEEKIKIEQEDDDGEEDALIGLLSTMCSESERITSYQNSQMRQILHEQWKEHDRNLKVGHIADAMKAHSDGRVRDLGEQLYAFTERGAYGRFFNGKNNIDLDASLTVLELEELKSRSHLQKVVLFQLIYQIQQEVYLGDRSIPKVLIIDESWDLIANGGPEVRLFIEHAYRRFRKYGASVCLVSQAIGDMYKSTVGDAILDNTATIGLFRHKEEAVETLKREQRLVMSEGGYHLLKTVHTLPPHYSEVFIKSERGIGVGRLFVSEFSKLLYSTNAADIAAIDIYKNRGLSVVEAIRQVLQDRGIKE